MSEKLTIGITIVLLTSLLPLFGQAIQVKASLDSSYLLIGARANLTLEVIKPEEVAVRFPLIVDTLTRTVEVLETSPIDSALTEEGLVKLTQTVALTSFDSGYQRVPPLPFVTQTVKGIDTFFTEPVGFDLLLVPVDTTQAIKPIKGPETVPLTLQELLPWILGGLMLVALAVGLYIYFKKRKKPEEGVNRHPLPKEPAHVIALRALDSLKNEKLWQSGKVKTYHSRLTDIVRGYIEHRFKITALEQTSDEIFDSFRNSGLANQVPFENLQQMLHLADLVKFAKGKPKPDENYRSLEQAYEFVEKTILDKPAEQEVEGEEQQPKHYVRNYFSKSRSIMAVDRIDTPEHWLCTVPDKMAGLRSAFEFGFVKECSEFMEILSAAFAGRTAIINDRPGDCCLGPATVFGKLDRYRNRRHRYRGVYRYFG